MFVLDNTKRQNGHYSGIIEWLEKNVGYDGAEWDTEIESSYPWSDTMRVRCIIFKNPEHEVLTKLRWQ